MVAIVGPSGSGKSTFADLLTGVLRPNSGKITIDGISQNEICLEQFRKIIGFIPQDPILFNDTVANNICLWQGDPRDESIYLKIKDAAKKASAEDFILQMSEKYFSHVGDRGINLSGGEKQRIAIARELYNNPEILILDEATSALDSESEENIKLSINGLKGETTVLIIAHRLSTIKNCDEILVLNNGSIVERGSFDELNNQTDSLFSKMCKMQNLK
jgi:subfamily B ATP-binding cassette protein MsbA